MTRFRSGDAPAVAHATHTSRVRGAAIAVVAFALGACAYPLEAQATPPVNPAPGTTPGTTTPALAPYRAPAIALVQPLPGGTVPQDRAALVVRFAQGEPDDPIDVASFAVAVDGEDRTKAFQVTVTQAWGTLGKPDDASSWLGVGAHRVAMRICSTRNACAAGEETVTVLPAMSAEAAATPVQGSKVKRALGALLSAGRKLLTP